MALAVTTAVTPTDFPCIGRKSWPSNTDDFWKLVLTGSAFFSQFVVSASAADLAKAWIIKPPGAGKRIFVMQPEFSTLGISVAAATFHLGTSAEAVDPPTVLTYLVTVKLRTGTSGTSYDEPLPGFRKYWLPAGEGLALEKLVSAEAYNHNFSVLWAIANTTGAS